MLSTLRFPCTSRPRYSLAVWVFPGVFQDSNEAEHNCPSILKYHFISAAAGQNRKVEHSALMLPLRYAVLKEVGQFSQITIKWIGWKNVTHWEKPREADSSYEWMCVKESVSLFSWTKKSLLSHCYLYVPVFSQRSVLTLNAQSAGRINSIKSCLWLDSRPQGLCLGVM